MSGYTQRPLASRPPSQQNQQQQRHDQFNRLYDENNEDDNDNDSDDSSSSDQEPATMAFVEESLVSDDRNRLGLSGSDKDKDFDHKGLDLNGTGTTKPLHDSAVLAEADAEAPADNELLLQENATTSPNNSNNNKEKRAAPSPSHGDDDDDDNAKPKRKHAKRERPSMSAARKRWNAVSLREEVAAKALDDAEVQLQEAQQVLHDRKLELEQAQKDYITAGDELCPELCREESKYWYGHYQNLLVFIDMEGHTIVPMNANQKWRRKFPPVVGLAGWVNRNRKEYADGRLKPIYCKALKQVDFDWNPCETRWMKFYQHLVDYKTEHGDTCVSNLKTSDGHKDDDGLGAWVKRQQYQWSLFQERKPCDITKERIQLLDELGMVWTRREEAWVARYNELLAFQTEHGHIRVPASNHSLHEWQSTQRSQWKSFQIDPSQSTLTHNQVQKLVAVGMEIDVRETKWRAKYQDLKEFIQKHGHHARVPLRYAFCPGLGDWESSLRRQHRKNLEGKSTPLTKERITLLAEIGFDFTIESSEREKIARMIKKTWDEYYAELLEVQHKYGCIKILDDTPDLHAWAQVQRRDYALFEDDPQTSLLTEERVKKLRELNFDFEFEKKCVKTWDVLYAEIMEHYVLEQSFTVKPRGNPSLNEWKVEQQEEYEKYTSGKPSKLTSAKIEMLIAINFPFNLRGKKKKLFLSKSWEELYSELLVFLIKHKDFDVPEAEQNELWTWCAKQRKVYRPNNHYLDMKILVRIEKLKKIGFPFIVTPPKAKTPIPHGVSAPAWPYAQYPVPHPEVASLAAAGAPPSKSKHHPPGPPVTSNRGRAIPPGPRPPPGPHRDTHGPPYHYSNPWPPPVYPYPHPHSKTAPRAVPPGGAPTPSKTISPDAAGALRTEPPAADPTQVPYSLLMNSHPAEGPYSMLINRMPRK